MENPSGTSVTSQGWRSSNTSDCDENIPPPPKVLPFGHIAIALKYGGRLIADHEENALRLSDAKYSNKSPVGDISQRRS
jgi:hypothetical protein